MAIPIKIRRFIKLAVFIATMLPVLIFYWTGSASSEVLMTGDGPASDIIVVMDSSGSMSEVNKESIETFVQGLRENTNLGIISFSGDAKMLVPLQPAKAEGKKAAMDAIGRLEFSGYTIFNPALSMAQAEMKKSSRPDANKYIVLISDGTMDIPLGDATSESLLMELRETILPGYRKDKVVIYSVAFQEADLQLMHELAAGTGGKSLIASNSQALSDALALVGEKVQPVTLTTQETNAVGQGDGESGKDFSDLGLIVGGAGGGLIVLLAMGLVMLNSSNRKLRSGLEPVEPAERAEVPTAGITTSGPRTAGSDAPVFVQLRENMGQLKSQLDKAGADMEELRLDLEDFGVGAWEKEKKSNENYYGLVKDLLLLLDHLEKYSRETESEDLNWVQIKVNRLLEDADIEEMKVSVGDQFDGNLHKVVENRKDGRPRGEILEIARKGYLVKNEDGEDVAIVRKAEVIVSDARSES